MELKENERIDDLQYKGLKIIQDSTGFCFGIDSVILANFAKSIKEGSNVVDLGSGTGILDILLCGKTKLKHITGIELQPEVAEMSKRSISLNNLEERMSIINDDLKNIKDKKYFELGSIDAVITNPPYKAMNTGVTNENKKKFISRHETTAKLEEFIKTAAMLLKNKGEFYIVNKPERLVDIVEEMRKSRIEPKEIRLIYPSLGKEANLVLVKGTKNANKFLKIGKPLYIYNEDGSYTEEIKIIYDERSE